MHKNMMSATLPTSLQQTDSNPPESSSIRYHDHAGFAPTSKHDDNGVEKSVNHRPNTKRRTFWLIKGIAMLKLERMQRQTVGTLQDYTIMPRLIREISDF